MAYRTFFAAACLSAALLAMPAFAEEAKAPVKGEHMGGFCERMQETTLEEARDHAKKRLDELTAMTPKEWEAKKEKFHARCEHWRDRREQRKAANSTTPSKK